MSEQKKRIIIVEDDPAISEIYQTVLEKASFQVEVISSGQEAISKIKEQATGEERPDLVILDLILPDIDGIEVLSALRKEPTTKDLIVFIFSNQENTETEEIKAARPDKYLIKANTTPTHLVEIVRKELGQ